MSTASVTVALPISAGGPFAPQMTLPIAVPAGQGHERMADIAPSLWDTIVTQIVGRAHQLLEQMRGCPRCATMVLRVVLDRYRPINGDRVWPSNEFILDQIERLFPNAKASLRSIERSIGYLMRIGLRKITDPEELHAGPGAYQYPEELRRADQIVPTWDVAGLLRLVSDQFTQMIASAGKALFGHPTSSAVPESVPVKKTLLEDPSPPDLPPVTTALSKVELDNTQENRIGSDQAAGGGAILPPNLAERNNERAHTHEGIAAVSVSGLPAPVETAGAAAASALRNAWPKREKGHSSLKHHVAAQMIAAMEADWCLELCAYGRWAVSADSGIAGTIGDVGKWLWGTYVENRALKAAGKPYPWPDDFVDHLKRLGADGKVAHRAGDLLSYEDVGRDMAREAATRRVIAAPQPAAIASAMPAADTAAFAAKWVGATGIEKPAELLAVWETFLRLARARVPKRIFHWYVAGKLVPLSWDAAGRKALVLCETAEGREKLNAGLHTEKLAEALRDALGLAAAETVRVRLVDTLTASQVCDVARRADDMPNGKERRR